MALTAAALNVSADGLAAVATHVGLVDDVGTELTGGAYARLAVTWTAAAGGLIRPTVDKTFEVPAGATVGGWRTYSASSAGVDYGGQAVTNETYAGAGQYTLEAAATAIDYDSV